MAIPHRPEIQKLARSIYYWLNYVETVSKSQLLLESSVRYPLAEYIERQVRAIVSLEVPHPLFSGHNLDFVYKKDKNQRNIELKYLHEYSNDTNERQRIFNDLIRLAVLKDNGYFILCGSQIDFNNIIAFVPGEIKGKSIPDGSKQRTRRRNDFSKWLPLEYDKKPMKVELSNFQKYKARFINAYHTFPDGFTSFYVQLVSRMDSGGTQVVYIWRVFK